MSWFPIEVFQGLIGTGETTFYIVPPGQQLVIKEFILCNHTTTAATVTLHIRRGGVDVHVMRRILSARTIPGNETIYFPCSIVLNAGGIISAVSGTMGAITITISGEQRTV